MAIFKKVVLGNNTYLHIEMNVHNTKLYRVRNKNTQPGSPQGYYDKPEEEFDSLNEFIIHCKLLNIDP